MLRVAQAHSDHAHCIFVPAWPVGRDELGDGGKMKHSLVEAPCYGMLVPLEEGFPGVLPNTALAEINDECYLPRFETGVLDSAGDEARNERGEPLAVPSFQKVHNQESRSIARILTLGAGRCRGFLGSRVLWNSPG
jgi:hypothetical protein